MLRSRCTPVESRPLRRCTTALVGVAALVGTTVGFVSTAGAAGVATPSGGALPTAHPDGASASNFLAGYEATPSGGVASASVTFKVPSASCTREDSVSNAEVNFGVFTNLNVFAFVVAECTNTALTYDYYVNTPTSDKVVPATEGDTVVTSIFESASSTFAEIHDLTTNQSYVAQDEVTPTNDTVVNVGGYAFWSQASLPVPTFSKVTLSNATVNGDYLGFDSPAQYSVLNGAVTLVKTGGLTTSATGSSFSLTFKHAS